VVDVAMPQMGVSVSEGTIVEWAKQVGDWVAYEETLCLISTDKIDTDCPSPAAGRITEILVEPGTTVDVGTVLARIATDAKPGEAHATEGTVPPVADATERTDPPERTQHDGRANGRRYSPVVSRMAAEHGIDLARIAGSGLGGRVTKKDVLAYLENGGAAQPAAAEPPMHIESPYRPDPEVPTAAAAGGGLSRMRRSIGEHMKRSLEVAATCTTWIEVDFARVESARAQLGTTALPVVARATIDALREFPALNATLDGDAYQQHASVNLGIAVSLGEDGLIVPVIHDAQDLSAEGLGRRIKDLARRARTKDLVPDDVANATFTITNPGQYGSIMATPVINQPQVAILDVEAVVKRPVVITDADGNDSIAIRPMCILGMSWDHRALDGALAAQFLAAIRRRLETL
jgi:pyruvate/2-oxoglutarate dehydrogenase complex dihydrolipoamide acyltransferase (E2) component